MGGEQKLPGTLEPQEGRCGSKLEGSERKYGHVRYCAKHPLHGKKRCRRHGGKALAGIASPTFKHGRYSAYETVLNGHLLERFNRANSDPEFLSGRKDIALTQSLIETELARFKVNAPAKVQEKWIRRLNELLDQKRRLQDSHTRRGEQLQNLLSLQQVNAILNRTVEVLKRHVTDKDLMNAIWSDLQPLLMGGNRRADQQPPALPAEGETV